MTNYMTSLINLINNLLIYNIILKFIKTLLYHILSIYKYIVNIYLYYN